MRILVAGASGFLGRHVVALLESRGHEVVALDRGTRAAAGGARRVRCDVGREAVPEDARAGVEAIVNLVGIKRPTDRQGFEQAHVQATRTLIEAARSGGIARYVHVSVVCARPDGTSPYHDTKWRAEELVRASGLRYTILRPGVLYGAGDDMLTHLTKMIRFAPVFPIVGHGLSILQPVDAHDVAQAVALALERPLSEGKTYDIVGPDPLPLRTIVRTVALALELPLAVLPTPPWLMRPAVALMSAVSTKALSTPSQLRMLEEGMAGDPEPARAELGLVPRPFTADRVRPIVAAVPSLLDLSLRGVSTDEERAWLARLRPLFGRAVALGTAGVLAFPLTALVLGNVWYRMALFGVLFTIAAFAVVPLPWRELYRASGRRIFEGVWAAVFLYGAGAVVFHLLRLLPAAAAQIHALFAWRDGLPAWQTLPLLLGIVLAEEVVWRNAVTLPLAARWGPLRGALVAALFFAAAHLSLGVPVLLAAALGAGFFWSALVVATRSAVPSLVSHVLWDLAVMFVLPYGG